MDLSAIGSMYLKNAAIGGSLFDAKGTSDADSSSSSFALMLQAASKIEKSAADAPEAWAASGGASPVPSMGRPLGAAANAGSRDIAHAAKVSPSIDRTSKLYEQCRELESFVIKSLLDGMRKTVEKSGFIDGGYAGEMYEDMLYDEYAANLSKTAGFGLADQAYLELSGTRLRA